MFVPIISKCGEKATKVCLFVGQFVNELDLLEKIGEWMI
jgi:hypothetical protein